MSTSKLKLSPPSNSDFKTPAILSISSDSINKAGLSSMSTENFIPMEVIPRFDWIQKTVDLSIIFYTKSFCNPAVVIEQICDNKVDVKIFILNITFEYIFSLTKDVLWPCVVKIGQETGRCLIIKCLQVLKIQIIFKL